VIAPARSLAIISEPNHQLALHRLSTKYNLKVEYGRHVEDVDWQHSASIKKRLDDLHDAFNSGHVKAILTVIGGFNSNELLPFIDYQLIKDNPKILCGFSDITGLCTAVTAKTGMVTYSGPHFSTFSVPGECSTFTEDWFEKVLFGADNDNERQKPLLLSSSPVFRDDAWFLPSSNNPPAIKINTGHVWITKGSSDQSVTGQALAGNLAVIGLLQGTPYWPTLTDKLVLMLEWCAEAREKLDLPMFTQRLHSLLQCVGGDRVVAIVFGRMESESRISIEDIVKLASVLKENHLLCDEVKVIANVDFGHTVPVLTLPIGGLVKVDRDGITLVEY
jgi:muramoyltetrapeptide carboxypeptidase LdcA involved in peptidoglycan recycling